MWNTVGAFGTLLAAACFVAAVAVYASQARRLQNRLLATILGFLGVAWLAGGGFMYMTDDPAQVWAWQVAAFVPFSAVPWLYVAFLSTLPTPLARPLARARPVLYGVAGVLAGWVLLDAFAFVSGVVPGTFSLWNIELGAAFPWIGIPNVAAGVLGLAVAFLAVRAAPRGSLARAQAVAYLVAFAVYDAFNLTFALVSLFGAFPDAVVYVHLTLTFAFVVLLAYGALKAQLFDIDLKVKWTIRQSTVAAVFVGVFFVASEAAAAFFTDRIGTYAGILAAGLLVLAVAPLQRLAERVSDRAFPRVQDTPEYRLVKKREVYRAAIEGALEDGAVSDKERAMLARVAEQLGLGPVDMLAIEREALSARRAVP